MDFSQSRFALSMTQSAGMENKASSLFQRIRSLDDELTHYKMASEENWLAIIQQLHKKATSSFMCRHPDILQIERDVSRLNIELEASSTIESSRIADNRTQEAMAALQARLSDQIQEMASDRARLQAKLVRTATDKVDEVFANVSRVESKADANRERLEELRHQLAEERRQSQTMEAAFVTALTSCKDKVKSEMSAMKEDATAKRRRIEAAAADLRERCGRELGLERAAREESAGVLMELLDGVSGQVARARTIV